MTTHSNHQNQALTILAIATAAIGFGFFGVEFRTGGILLESGIGPFAARLKLGLGLMALAFYATTLAAVGKILIDENATGKQVAYGPLFRMSLELLYVALIFIVGIFEEPATN